MQSAIAADEEYNLSLPNCNGPWEVADSSKTGQDGAPDDDTSCRVFT